MSELYIKLEGYPEKVQRAADAIEAAFPELISWIQARGASQEITIAIKGHDRPVRLCQRPKRDTAEEA
jgi:hypothetical protein